MTQTQAISSDVSGNRIFRFIGLLYGLVAYFAFFGTILSGSGVRCRPLSGRLPIRTSR